MKTIRTPRAWIWGFAILGLMILGFLAYVFLPGQGKLPDLPAPDYWPTNGWRTTPPEQQGLDSARLAEGIQAIHDKHVAIDSVMIIRNGYMVLDAYFSPYDGSFPHDFGSVTKSVTTILVAIAAEQGRLGLDQPVVSFFTDRTIANLDDRKKSLTVRDLVSMRNGMESGCFHGDEPTLDAMRSQPDWVQAALDRKMTSQPGTKFCYDSPGMHLLSAILQKATGMTELDFARQYLFEPLGIQDVAWETDPQGYYHGWGDLHLKPQDAAKLGLLWLQQGKWEDHQIVSAAWVSDSVRAHSRLVGNEFGYGNGWWVSPIDFYALGRGGQYIRVIPFMNAVVVVTAGGSDIDLAFLIKTFLGAPAQLPADPAGQTKLTAALSAAAQGSGSHPSTVQPDIARVVSGTTYTCDTNPVGVTSFRMEFNDPKTGIFSMLRNGQETTSPIGLDGKYLLDSQGTAHSGYWEDSQTFILEVFDIGQLTRWFHFDADRLDVTVPEIDLTLKCQVQNP
jgi:CubicO group peptidase (beta-lactamase class C family)